MDPDRPARRSVAVPLFLSLAMTITLLGGVIVAARSAMPPREPAAGEARAGAISYARETILAECQKAAGGDWQRWQTETEPYRAALRCKLGGVKRCDPDREPLPKGLPGVLEGKDGFPLFEVKPSAGIEYLYCPESLDQFRADRDVVAVHHWLRQRGIDLIFIPVPKMTEVYVDQILDPCPPDGIIAPHIRQTLLELLDDDVEVVDGLPLFRRVRDSDPEYLYNAADTHWAPRGMQVMAQEVAARIRRYSFGAEARSRPPVVTSTPVPFDIQLVPTSVKTGDLPRMDGWADLTAEQKKRVEAAQTRTVAHVTLPDGREPPDDPQSPVMFYGNCYAVNFTGMLIKEMNLLMRTRWAKSQTTEGFSAFLREPELLDGCRVFIWIVSEQHLPHFYRIQEPIKKALPSGN
jgi:hypothetical protein